MDKVRPAGGRVAVVGGGILGSSIALALLDAGCDVTVFDPDVLGCAASWGNAGHIAVEQVEPLASLATLAELPSRLWGRNGALALPPTEMRTWLPFGLSLVRAASPRRFAHGKAALSTLMGDALPAWQRLAQRLGQPDLIRAEGHFIVWESARTAERGMRAACSTDLPTAAYRPADEDELRALTALTGSRLAGAVRCLGTARISSHARLRQGLRTAIDAAGGSWCPRAVELARGGDGQVRVLGEAPFDTVVLAAGIFSRALAERLGHVVPMVPERGYHLHGAGAHWPEHLPPVVFEDRSMIVTRFADGVRASSFLELAPVERPADRSRWDALRRHVAELNLPFDRDHREWMGARPTLPDYLPAIGRSRRAPNLVYAFGHQHLGLTLGPVTAGLVRDLVRGTRPSLDLSPFDLARFERSGTS
ncbi:NAD(P)/FAD-dependent oxidoreductase [Novosphingobium nitrogenifigens]|uniref:NAD(P)/FAD-dependent oxidoreductase n=1 Tax=Novosphingobium nitrogenifigens TaxID=378548 RepID=UPI000680CE2F|nr:FAD-binding oxidoreductase [Novosphingobium nitrogenifigens]